MSESYNSNIDFSKCPVGIMNRDETIRVKDTMSMAIKRLEEKVDDMKDDITSLKASVNKRFDQVDDKMDTLEKKLSNKVSELDDTLPDRIDERIKTNTMMKKSLTIDKIMAIVLAVISTVCGGVTLVAVKMLLHM